MPDDPEPPANRPQDPARGVVLIGYRGAGKSTVGRHLAHSLGRPFVDLDDEVERLSGRSIPELFREEGEAGFRDRESMALASVVHEQPGSVLATGGGAVLREANRALLRRHGLIVWLAVDPTLLAQRLRADGGGRPSLTGRSLADEVAEVLETRTPIYQALADLTLNAGIEKPQVLCKMIMRWPDLRSGARG